MVRPNEVVPVEIVLHDFLELIVKRHFCGFLRKKVVVEQVRVQNF